MKSDSYLNLCIEQAHRSPLHYRHGAVVVKGGKILGQGFNDYRVGYDGGSVLKSGVLPKAARPVDDSDPPRSKPKHNSKFKPVEAVSGNCGGGHHANASLSMHSEMMAINSALASSSALAAGTAQHIKPCYKLHGDSKRKRVLRREALAAYVRKVCFDTATGAEAKQQQQCGGASSGGECYFDPATYQLGFLLSGGACSEAAAERSEEEESPSRPRGGASRRTTPVHPPVPTWIQAAVQQIQVV